MNILSKCEKYMNYFCRALLLIFTLVLVTVAFVQVVMRYCFSIGLNWTDEICRYMQVWITFIGAAYMLGQKGHIEVDLLKEKLSLRGARILDAFGLLLGILLACFITYYGSILALGEMNQISSGTRLPMGVVYSILPLGGVLIILYGIIRLVIYKEPSKIGEEEMPLQEELL